jgi:hypothetical protein
MKEKFKLLFSDQFMRISLVLSFVFVVPLIILIGFTFSSLPPFIPFFNSMPWGEQRLYSSGVVIFLPLILILIFIANILQAMAVYKKYTLLSRIVVFNCFLFLLLSLLSYLQILFLTM